jgi:hypothetical protein
VNISEKDLQELSSLMQKTGYDIWDEYYSGDRLRYLSTASFTHSGTGIVRI